jgi:hypothetical protein
VRVQHVVTLHQLIGDVENFIFSEAIPYFSAEFSTKGAILAHLHENIIIVFREAANWPCSNNIRVKR